MDSEGRHRVPGAVRDSGALERPEQDLGLVQLPAWRLPDEGGALRVQHSHVTQVVADRKPTVECHGQRGRDAVSDLPPDGVLNPGTRFLKYDYFILFFGPSEK